MVSEYLEEVKDQGKRWMGSARRELTLRKSSLAGLCLQDFDNVVG